MLALSGLRLGHSFTFLDPSPDACAGGVGDLVVAAYDDEEALGELGARSDVVTYEFENVDLDAVLALAAEVPLWPSAASLRAAQDRLAEKQLFEKTGLQVAPYVAVANAGELTAAIERTGVPCLIKARREGYDGKGQARIESVEAADAAWSSIGRVPSIVETLVPFTRELSIIAARATTGEAVFYPLIENHHSAGILRVSVAPAPDLEPRLQQRAEGFARALLEELDHVGVMAIEMFETEGELLGNEMAPRVHNSGHYSIEGAVTSQFENHVRAVTGSELASPTPVSLAVMVNLIGHVPDEGSLLAIPRAHLHLYGKEPRPGRKVGHVTITSDPGGLEASFNAVRELVPGTPAVSWDGDLERYRARENRFFGVY